MENVQYVMLIKWKRLADGYGGAIWLKNNTKSKC